MVKQFPSRALILAVCISGAVAASALSQEANQISVTYLGQKISLKKTGAAEIKHSRGERTRILFKFVHYMQDPPSGNGASVLEAMTKANSAKQIVIEAGRSYGAGKFGARIDAYIKDAASSSDMAKVQRNYNSLIGYLSGAFEEGDQATILWLPEGKVIISAPGQNEKMINDPELGPFLWSAWFGQSSPVNRLELVSSLAAR